MINAKYRGLRTDGKGFVYGVPISITQIEENPEDSINVACIITGCDWNGVFGFMPIPNELITEVKPETIGQLHNGLTRKANQDVYVGDEIIYDLAEGMGLKARRGCTGTVVNLEFDYHFYQNVRVTGNIHEKKTTS